MYKWLGVPLPWFIISLALMLLVVIWGLCYKRIENKKKFVFVALFVEYLFIVLCSTVLCRHTMKEHVMELVPYWFYKVFDIGNTDISPWDIFNNMLLMVPVGALLYGISPSIKWYKVLIIGLSCSLTIELLQYIFMKGFTQTDDILHNSMGCLIGWWIAKQIGLLFEKRRITES